MENDKGQLVCYKDDLFLDIHYDEIFYTKNVIIINKFFFFTNKKINVILFNKKKIQIILLFFFNLK